MHGLIAAPLQLFDPINNCVSRGFLSGAGAGKMNGWTLDEALELNRGAFALHTRSYQAKNRPLSPDSHFSVIFNRVAELALERFGGNLEGRGGNDTPRSLTPKGYRTVAEEDRYQMLRAKSVNQRDHVPDPAFLPSSPLYGVLVILHRIVCSMKWCCSVLAPSPTPAWL
jgi:hypothetical protein